MLSLLQNEQKGGGGEEMSVIKRTWYVTICHIKLAPSLQDLLQVLKIPSLGGGGITPDVALGRPRRPVPRCAGLEKIKYMNYLKVATPDTAPCLSFSKRPLQRIAWCDFLPFTHSWVNNKICIPKIQEG